MQVSNIRKPKTENRNLPPGFTLVEMLVAVALVLLMMTLFATIFQIATGAMATQKGLAENDQRVRLVLNRLRNDLNGIKNDPNDPNRPYRTFRNVVPYAADELNPNSTDRLGYIYISEGNPNDDTDDRIQLTVQFPATGFDQFYGKAALLFPDGNGSYGLSNPNPGAGYPPAGSVPVPIPSGIGYWPNQPDFDDIFGTVNQVGNSPYAEVCYFLRNGTLYRRVMLIRDPNGLASPPPDGTPTDASGKVLKFGTYTNVARTFWNDFDYSAFFDSIVNNDLRFHGTGTTTDSLSPVGTGLANPFILGNPAYRFGFDSSTVLNAGKTAQIPSATYGQPRDYVTTPAGITYYIGAFTHAETSDLAFGYPGSISGTNPMSNSTKLSYDTVNGRVGVGGVNFNGPRSGEDILMTNVLKFDIKVFDPAASFGPDGRPGVAGVDDDGDGNADFINGQPDLKELAWPGSDDGAFVDLGHSGTRGFYASSNTAKVADFSPQVNNKNAIMISGPTNVPVTSRVKIVNWPGVPPGGDAGVTFGKLQSYVYPNTYYNYGSGGVAPLPPFANRYDTWNPLLNLDNITDTNGNPLSDVPPYRPFNFGADGAPGTKGIDDDGNGATDYVTDPNTGLLVPDPREIGWPNTDDQPVPLSAIQIKITFYDVTSQQIRDVTLVQSLLYVP